MNTHESFSAFVGIDWAYRKHDICLKPAAGGRVEHRVSPHTAQDIDAWAAELGARFHA